MRTKSQAVYPAFFSLYVAKERRSAVQAMQLSNGLSDPVGLWLGHLLFDSIFGVVSASLIVIIFAAATNRFHGLGFFVRCTFLYLSTLRRLTDVYHSGLCLCFMALSVHCSRTVSP